jgi:hypothetical protein
MEAAAPHQNNPTGPLRQPDVSARTGAESFGRIPCPVCGFPIGAVKGSKAAICDNCGFKDGCC